MSDAFNRRTVLAAAGMTILAAPGLRAAPMRKRLSLELVTADLALRSGQAPTRAWRFADIDVPRFVQGDQIDVTIANRLPAGVQIHWRGLHGAPAFESAPGQERIEPGGSATSALTVKHAGTLLCEIRPGDGTSSFALPIVVAENALGEVDRDEVLLLEDWRLLANGSAISPGVNAAGVQPIYTLNGQAGFKLDARPNERLRLRFINGAQRSVIATQVYDLEVRVIAIDGQPSEPFPARDGRLVMAPGTRVDAILDTQSAGTHALTLNDGDRSFSLGEIQVSGQPKRAQALPPFGPLPSNGLPQKLALQSALRVDVPLDAATGWSVASAAAIVPAFRVKRGRVVVLTLANPADVTTVFHLHGHHMRLLDRLDDGWKPFWLDTIAVPAKQTVRVAFAAERPGRCQMEMTTTGWASRRSLRSFYIDA